MYSDSQFYRKQPRIHPRLNGRFKTSVAINPTRLSNIPTREVATVTGTEPTRAIGWYGEELKFTTSDALDFTDPGLSSSDFLCTAVIDKSSSADSFQYFMSGTTATAGGGIHLFIAHSTASGQWGLHNVSAKGSGNTLSANTRYVLSWRRVGDTVYFLQDGEPTTTASITLNNPGDVFLDTTWSLNQYQPTGTLRGNPGIAHISVLKGTYSENDARNMSKNPWQIYRKNEYIPTEVIVSGLSVPIAAYHYNHNVGSNL